MSTSDPIVVKQHDTSPVIPISLTSAGDPLDLTSAGGIRIIGAQKRAVIFDKDVTGTDVGVVELTFEAGDLDVAAPIFVEVEVTWDNGSVQTFPNDGYLNIKVIADLG